MLLQWKKSNNGCSAVNTGSFIGRIYYIAAAILIVFLCSEVQAKHIKVIVYKDPPAAVTIFGRHILSESGYNNRYVSEVNTHIKTHNGSIRVGNKSGLKRINVYPHSNDGLVKIASDNSSQIRLYRGWIEIRQKNNALLVINHIDVEDYLKSVLPNEMPVGWKHDAYAAQAVAARSYTYANLSRHSSDGADMCSLTHCQVYKGAVSERADTNRAVLSTAGLVLYWNNKCISAPYHSTCGGCTTNYLNNGRAPEKYLSSVSDVIDGTILCSKSPHFYWHTNLKLDKISEYVRADGINIPKNIRSIQIKKRDESGRALVIQLIGDSKKDISGADFMNACGRHSSWSNIKSTKFTVKQLDKSAVFSGKGLGHGVGLCQWGANAMAAKGYDYKRILNHYFPKCRIAPYKGTIYK